jgi:hypothetical protein
VKVAGTGEEGIFLDQPGIISDVEAVVAVDQIVAGTAVEVLVAVLAEELVVALAPVQRVAAIAAVDDVVAAEAVDRVGAVAAVDEIVGAGAGMRRHVEFLPLSTTRRSAHLISRESELSRLQMMLARPLPV